MAIERSFSIIKPDATGRNLTGAINDMIERAGLRIVAQKRARISREQAEKRPFAMHCVEFLRLLPADAGGEILRSASRTAVFPRACRFHDLRAGGRASARG